MLSRKIENLLTPSYHKTLLTDAKRHLKYGYDDQTVYNTETFKLYDDKRIFDPGQLTCTIFNPSATKTEIRYADYYLHVKPLLYSIQDAFQLKIKEIYRLKFNILLQRPDAPDGSFNHPHRDVQIDAYSCIYYLNDSDGDTIFFNESYTDKQPESLTIHSTNTPKANTAILFNSRQLHASSSPRITKARYAINMVFAAEEINPQAQ
jgi:hypothetical protein